jgi:hypothetical protein
LPNHTYRQNSLFRNFDALRELAAPAAHIAGFRAFRKKSQVRVESADFDRQLQIDALFAAPVVCGYGSQLLQAFPMLGSGSV